MGVPTRRPARGGEGVGRWRSAGLVEGKRQEGVTSFSQNLELDREGARTELRKRQGSEKVFIYRLRGQSPGEPRALVACEGAFSGLFPNILEKVLHQLLKTFFGENTPNSTFQLAQ